MGDLDDLFGPGPMGDRPDHDDFKALVHLVLQQDGKTEDADFDMDAYLASMGDPGSISYVAIQRALRVLQLITGPDLQGDHHLWIMLSSLWIDGFMIGARFADREGS